MAFGRRRISSSTKARMSPVAWGRAAWSFSILVAIREGFASGGRPWLGAAGKGLGERFCAVPGSGVMVLDDTKAAGARMRLAARLGWVASQDWQ